MTCLSCLFVRYDADADIYYCPYRRIVQDGDWQGDDKPCERYIKKWKVCFDMYVPSIEEMKNWLLSAKAEGATHVLIVCDTFDYEDYSVSVMPDEDVNKKYETYNGKNMQKVMEVYNLSMDIDEQLSKIKTMNF